MKKMHVPRIDARYWSAITLASIFGTNMGDLYAHESGLGILQGLAVLAVLAAFAFRVERFDRISHESYYWLVIIIIRTGATNIADYVAFRLRIAPFILIVGLLSLLAVLAWYSGRRPARSPASTSVDKLPDTNGWYWGAMLTAGVFGTVFGDICSHWAGQGVASLMLGALLAAALFARSRSYTASLTLYWLTIACARSAGTSMGDWFAENRTLNIGLPLSTLITGCAFVGVIVLWRIRVSAPAVTQ